LLANGRAELCLKDFLVVFQSWKEAILNAETIHQEEEKQFQLTIERPQSYYTTDNVLQSGKFLFLFL
jgi:hypothetical protein